MHNNKSKSPHMKRSVSPHRYISPNGRGSQFKPKKLSDLRPINDKRSSSPSRHEKSMSTMFSRFVTNKSYHMNHHDLGYNQAEIKEAVAFIFNKYDSNKDNLLDRKEVAALLTSSLKHMNSQHIPSELEVIEFIYSMDKNNDGKLSRQELQNAFKRANRLDY